MTNPRSRPVFHPVADGVHVLDPAIGADSMAVLGAMMSRAPDLGAKFEQVAASAQTDVETLIHAVLTETEAGYAEPVFGTYRETTKQLLRELAARMQETQWNFANPPERVRAFLESNLAGYGHASIASMAKAAFLYLSGFGWPSAWLLEDSPLFDGQEVSTRAVDAAAIPGADGPGTPCRYAPASLRELHDRWMQVYAQVRNEATGGGWKYDDARVFLPGTIPTGVVWTNDVRTIARQLDQIRGLGGFGEQLAAQGYAGLEAAAPVTTKAIGHRDRRALAQWVIRRSGTNGRSADEGPAFGTYVSQWDHMPTGISWADFGEGIPSRERHNQHLDPLWRQAPRFKFTVTCSVAVARDWHRHRPLMPWSLEVVHDGDHGIVLAPWYRMEERLPAGLLADTSRAFAALGGWDIAMADGRGIPSARQWEALHALPFGALVQLSCVATLPDLVYMLELRATTKGANPEYKAQALDALRQLCAQLPPQLVASEHLDGALTQASAMHVI